MHSPITWMRSCFLFSLLSLGFSTGAEPQTPCEESIRNGGSVLKGKTYEVHADFLGIDTQRALDRLAAGLPAREIEIVAVDTDRGLIVGRTNSPGQRPYSVEFQVSSAPGGSRGRLLLSLPFGAFAAPGMASELCKMLSLALVATSAETMTVPTLQSTTVEETANPSVKPCSRANQLISEDRAGEVRLGMTVTEVRSALPPESIIKRTSSGDGLALIEVTVDDELMMILYAGEEDYEMPIRDSAIIDAIWVYSDKFATVEGICPGMLVDEAAGILGGSPKLTLSEIESREYAVFPRQPVGFEFQIRGGIFAEGTRDSRHYQPTASILNIFLD